MDLVTEAQPYGTWPIAGICQSEFRPAVTITTFFVKKYHY